MFDPEDDTFLITLGEYLTYFSVIFILWSLHLGWIAVYYIIIGYSIAFTDDDVDSMHDDPVWHFAETHTGLWPLAQRLGFELTEFMLAEILGTTVEDPLLPGSYAILESYYRFFIMRFQNKEHFLQSDDKFKYDVQHLHPH